MITRRRFAGLAAASALAPALTAGAARAQAWPRRFVKLVVPFPPGGGTDGVARILANRLSEVWGQQMVIENKGGAGSNIGAEAVARAEPDGYTMLIGSLPLAVNRYLYPSLNYDPIADFAPVSLICLYPNLMVVPNSSPAKSVMEFVAHAKANRGKITFASSGTGTSTHLSGELFKRMTGIEMTHVPYRGSAPALQDTIAGRLDLIFDNVTPSLPQVKGGRARGLAVTTAKRVPAVPELPTIAEAGVPGFDVSSWFGFFVPGKTPPAIIKKMNEDTVAALAHPPVRERLEQLGAAVVGSTPAELATFLKSEMDKWGPVIREAKIKIDE